MNKMRNAQVMDILKVELGELVAILDKRFNPKRETKANFMLFGLLSQRDGDTIDEMGEIAEPLIKITHISCMETLQQTLLEINHIHKMCAAANFAWYNLGTKILKSLATLT